MAAMKEKGFPGVLLRIKDKRKRIPGRFALFAVILGFLRTGSMYFYDSAGKTAPVFLLRLFLYSAGFLAVFAVGRLFAEKICRACMGGSGLQRPGRNWVTYCVLFVGWLPHLIVKYPGSICWDSWRMLYFFRTEGFLDGHHSLFYSWLLGSCVSVFEKAGHPAWGLWLFILAQFVLYVFAFGYSINLLRRMGARRWLVWLTGAFWLVCPYIIGYLGVAIKDAAYAVLVFLMVLFSVECCIDKEAFCGNRKKMLLLFLSALGCCLIRRNGIYVVAATALFSLIPALRSRQFRMVCGKRWYRPVLAMVCACCFAFAVNGILGALYTARKGSVKDALSLPFQQTARYVKYHSDDVTEDERKVIDSVLRYDTLAERYDPRIADPVKGKYTGRDEQLPAYFYVWLKQFFRHPLSYVAATWEQNYYLFVPEAERNNIVLYQDDDVGYELDEMIVVSERTKYYEPLFRGPSALEQPKEQAVSVYRALHGIFPIDVFSNVSVNAYALFFLICCVIRRRKGEMLPFCPALCSFVFVILGPVIQGHPRYMFPVIYSIPVLAVFTLYCFVGGNGLTEKRPETPVE